MLDLGDALEATDYDSVESSSDVESAASSKSSLPFEHCIAFDSESSVAWNLSQDNLNSEDTSSEWFEDDFDAIGIAKCCHCGMKLPIEQVDQHLVECSMLALLEDHSEELPTIECSKRSKVSELGDIDWEGDFDAIGIAKCSHCEQKLPADEDAIEKHLRVCTGEGSPHHRRSCLLAMSASPQPMK